MDDQQLFLRKLNRRTRFTQFLVWIALFFTAVGIAAGYKNWLRIHEKAKTGLRGIAEIKKELPNFAEKKRLQFIEETINKRLNQNSEQFDQTIKKLKVIQKSTEYIASTVYQQVEKITKVQTTTHTTLVPQNDWRLSEIHFLLQTAVQVLSLKQDKESATTALTLADNMLQKKGLESLFPLRKQISQDIAILHEYQPPKLSMLSEKISKLQDKIAAEQVQKSKQGVAARAKKLDNKNKDQSIVVKLKNTLNKAIVVRRYNQPLHNEMNEETRETLFQLLSLKLETLRITLLLKQDKNYHNQLSHLKLLLEKYKYLALMSELNALEMVNLSPKMPDISGSLNLFESLISNNKGLK